MNVTMTGRGARKLRDMEIDEVSLVDRAANQHASIMISKAADQEDAMPELDELEIYDDQGNVLDIADLPVGSVIEGPDGEELVVVEGDLDPAYDEQLELDYDPVDKAFAVGASGTARQLGNAVVVSGSKRPRFLAGHQFRHGFRNKGWTDGASRSYQAGAHLGRNKGKYAAGAAGTAVVGGGAYAGKKYYDDRVEASKSLGDALLEHLSKADADERTQILAHSMAEEIEKAQAQADEAMMYAEQLQDERITEAFISKAAEYNLPVDPTDLGLILKSAAAVLTDEQLDTLDQLFTSIGEFLYSEVGVLGDNDNVDVMSQVDAYTDELVGKSADGLSGAEAQVMLLATNPEMYDMYLSENGGR